ncbi:serine hydrolase [Sutcliffiella horikoshii]|uniref:serine hydrolase n=1 Tax=Sutcliffiella horikoshii TaxID=79883 RepID=UPI00292A4439|nr:serine hydrolase [Sutcliffiella horikoshii]
MNKVIDKLKEIDTGEIGLILFSCKEQRYDTALNSELSVPLAPAAKVAIGFCVAKWVDENTYNWEDLVNEISFNPEEGSKELYPHLQNRKSLPLREAIEVMISCHDSYVANCVVNYCGGWEKLNNSLQSYFPTINITENSRDIENRGQLNQILEIMIQIFQGYKTKPLLWIPIINGLVR